MWKTDNATLSEIAFATAFSLYMTGNYSGAQVWLRKEIEQLNEILNYNFTYYLRNERAIACTLLTVMGDFRCTPVVVKDQLIAFSVMFVHFVVRDEINPKHTDTYAKEQSTKTSKQTSLSRDYFCFVHFPTYYQFEYFTKILNSLKNKAVTLIVASMTAMLWVIFLVNVLLKVVKGVLLITLLILTVCPFSCCCGVCCTVIPSQCHVVSVSVILLGILTAYFCGGIQADDLP